MNTKKLILLMVVPLMGLKIIAQTNAVHLSLDSAVSMSLEQSRQLKINQSKIDEAHAKFLQAKSKQLPEARLSASYIRLSNNVDPFTIQLPGSSTVKELNPQVLNRYTPTFSVGQLIYAGGQVKYGEQSMRLLEEASQLDYQKNRTEIIYNAICAYFNLFKIQQTKKLIEENIIQVTDHLRDIKNYEKNGIALKNDVLKIELQLSNFGHGLIEITSAEETANYNMSIMLGLPVNSTYVLIDKDFNHQGSLKSLDEYQHEAVANRADLKAVDKRMGAAVFSMKSAIGNYFPTLSAGANYYYHNANQRVFPIEDKFKATWDAGVTLSWNISSFYTNKHKVAESKAIIAQTNTAKDQLLDEIRMEVNADFLSYNKSKQRIKVSEEAVAQAEENYRIVNNRFKHNTVLISDLTDANSLLLQTKVNLLVDQADTDIAYYKLLKSTGINK